MSNINEKSNFECKIFWNKDCLLPDDALKLDLNISNTTYEESLLLTTKYDDTKVFRSPEGLEFETRGDTAKITSYKGTATNVIIPSTFKHYDKTYKVTSIGSAFKDCENLTSISISDGVENIGGHAFADCKNLTSISIPNSVKNIGDHAFENCENLTSITIPNSVKNIGKDAFRNCKNLTSISIPDGVTSIGNYAFENCENLTSISIPYSVTSIENGAFRHCAKLTAINVEENNSYYKSIGGNLYSKNGTTLIQYAIGQTAASFSIPSSVTSIDDNAFTYCENLTSISIPYGVKNIGMVAFAYCKNLTSISIPYSVKNIESGAFRYCSSLTSVTFENTSGWLVDIWNSSSSSTEKSNISSVDLANTFTAARYLTSTYCYNRWERS